MNGKTTQPQDVSVSLTINGKKARNFVLPQDVSKNLTCEKCNKKMEWNKVHICKTPQKEEKNRLSLSRTLLILFTFLLIGQFIKETILLVVLFYSGNLFYVDLTDVQLIYLNYYIVIIGAIIGLGFLSIKRGNHQ